MKDFFCELKSKTNKEKTIYILKNLFLLVLPLIIEMLANKGVKISINKFSGIRLGYMYGLILVYYLYKITCKYTDKIKKVVDFIFKYRYAIAGITFLVMLVFKLNISNIGCWSIYFPDKQNTLIGENKIIRSDEWNVQIPFFFAQGMGEDYYPLNNDNIGEGQNMLMVYPAPALDITLISKPQNMGAVLLGKEYGFSWYSNMRVIALVLLSIELCMIITKKDKLLSIIGGLWLGFSPAIVWWFSSNGDIYIHAFAIIVLFHYYVTNLEWKTWKKLLIALGMISSIPGFVFCFYPPVQIPLAYVMLAFILVDFITNMKNIKGKDYAIMAVSIFIALLIVGYYVYVSMDDISAIMNTVYPGSRNLTGGTDTLKDATELYFNLFTTFTEEGLAQVGENRSEAAAAFIPTIALIIGILYSLRNFKEKIKNKENWLYYSLILIFAMVTLWLYVGFGSVLSKVTLFFLCQPKRVALIFGMIGMLLTIMLVTRKEISLDKVQTLIVCALAVLVAHILINSCGYRTYFGVTKSLILYTSIFIFNYIVITANKKAFAYFVLILTIASGMFINPVNVGADVLIKTETAQKIQEMVANDSEKSNWIGIATMDAQYLIANGARVLNGVNYYPNFEMLEKLDEEGKYNEVYNRYAHIGIELDKDLEDSVFELFQHDYYVIHLSIKDFEKLNIKYVYSSALLKDEITDSFNLNLVYSSDTEHKWIYEYVN